jgi:hypothetical protein
MRRKMVMATLLWWVMTPANAQISVAIRTSNASIGINLPTYPQLVRVPGYPVYYSPDIYSNYFFYDGNYWVYQDDYWYESAWYNGPWNLVEPIYVPEFVLRIPVRYYRQPPSYFRNWRASEAPRWDQHWGNNWSQRRTGWNQWNRNASPAPAPLPSYQRQYAGERYPQAAEQKTLQQRNYTYQSRTPITPAAQKQTPSQPAQRSTDKRTTVSQAPGSNRIDTGDSRKDNRPDNQPIRTQTAPANNQQRMQNTREVVPDATRPKSSPEIATQPETTQRQHGNGKTREAASQQRKDSDQRDSGVASRAHKEAPVVQDDDNTRNNRDQNRSR